MWLEYFIKGILIGLFASIPLGPIGVICIQRTLNKGKLSGFISGLGAATADSIFAGVASFSLTIIIVFIEERREVFQLIGGVVVALLGVKIFYTNPVRQLRRHKRKKSGMFEDFISVLFLTATNPLAIFLFVALFASFGVVSEETTWDHSLITLSGVAAGATLWWYLLTSTVNHFRKQFRLKQLWWVNKISGGVIFLLGLLAIVGVAKILFF
jgi:threonine/homoserine/homoserine lactone efflux protein